jgi:hypothetical protein
VNPTLISASHVHWLYDELYLLYERYPIMVIHHFDGIGARKSLNASVVGG